MPDYGRFPALDGVRSDVTFSGDGFQTTVCGVGAAKPYRRDVFLYKAAQLTPMFFS
jgi:hypothetical protein